MKKEKIDRINELAHKSKVMELSLEEKEEQQLLRREYIDAMKASLVEQVENIRYEDGSKPEKKTVKH